MINTVAEAYTNSPVWCRIRRLVSLILYSSPISRSPLAKLLEFRAVLALNFLIPSLFRLFEPLSETSIHSLSLNGVK